MAAIATIRALLRVFVQSLRSPKTEHHAGHESRLVPIFGELSPLFDKRYAEAAEGEQFVLPMLLGRTDASLRKTLKRAIEKAGLTVWPRLWHNLRSTRQTELDNSFPSHVVCTWLGNSEATAREHYLQVSEEHFAKAAQKAAQAADDEGGDDGQRRRETPVLPLLDNPGHSWTSIQLVREGFLRG